MFAIHSRIILLLCASALRRAGRHGNFTNATYPLPAPQASAAEPRTPKFLRLSPPQAVYHIRRHPRITPPAGTLSAQALAQRGSVELAAECDPGSRAWQFFRAAGKINGVNAVADRMVGVRNPHCWGPPGFIATPKFADVLPGAGIGWQYRVN
jgi:hypothetical protein